MSKIIIKEYLKKSIEYLKSQNIDSAIIDAEILVCFCLKKEKSWLYANFNHKLSQTQIKSLDRLIKKRSNNIPIAQITKNKEFYKLDYFINKNVLTPRPETELIVDEVLNITKKIKVDEIIDIGVGSGAIIITLAKNISNKNINFIGTDISDKALYVARKNVARHKINKKINFLKGNLLEPIINRHKLQDTSYNLIITANLPYLTPKQFKEEKSIQSEPKIALVSGQDGLKDYRVFFKQLKKIALKNKVTTIIEFDPAQTKRLKGLIIDNFKEAKIQTKKDLCGLNRIMIINN
jgi:release factor glutamine methyltransferase